MILSLRVQYFRKSVLRNCPGVFRIMKVYAVFEGVQDRNQFHHVVPLDCFLNPISKYANPYMI